MSDMRVNLCGVELKNPVIAASGTFGYGMEYSEFFPLSRLGGDFLQGHDPACARGKSQFPDRGNPVGYAQQRGTAESGSGSVPFHLPAPGSNSRERW